MQAGADRADAIAFPDARSGRRVRASPDAGVTPRFVVRTSSVSARCVSAVERRPCISELSDAVHRSWGPTCGSSIEWHSVERAVVEHAERLLEAVHDASGVYFPKRAHRVRVETKKLRYVLELVGSAESAAMVKRLRRAQEVLGQLHDHQVLAHSLSSTKRMDKTDRRALVTSVDAKCEELFQQYLTRRPQLVEVSVHARAAATRGAWRPRSIGGMLLTASAMAFRLPCSGSPARLFAASRQDRPRSLSAPAGAM